MKESRDDCPPDNDLDEDHKDKDCNDDEDDGFIWEGRGETISYFIGVLYLLFDCADRINNPFSIVSFPKCWDQVCPANPANFCIIQDRL